jgi:hypothetical protein
MPFRLQDRQEGTGQPSARDMRRHHRSHCGPGPERGFFLDKKHVHTTEGAILWAAALGPACAARAALVARSLTPGGVCGHLPDCRVFQGHIKVRRRHGRQILDAPLFQRLNQLAQARKGQGQEARGRCARGFNNHGRGPQGQRGRYALGQAPQYKHLRRGHIRHVHARGRPPSERALHGASHSVRDPARSLMCFCARAHLRRVRVDWICKNFMRYDLRSRHVCSLPGVVVLAQV